MPTCARSRRSSPAATTTSTSCWFARTSAGSMSRTTITFRSAMIPVLAGLVGGLGLAPGANLGNDAAIFEAVHGSAPDIAGKGVANPISLLLAAAMMLDHVGKSQLGDRIRTAIQQTLCDDQVRTRDLK